MRIFYVFLIWVFVGCTTSRELPLTYINYGYTIDKLLPLSKSSSPFSFRVWINNSTSINRVISVSIDSNGVNECKVIEIGDLYKNKKSNYFYSEKKALPKSGFSELKKSIDSLNLMEYKDQNPYDAIVVTHQSFSKYIVEININSKYNIFKFITYYPSKEPTNTKYDFIEKLIRNEFEIKFRFR